MATGQQIAEGNVVAKAPVITRPRIITSAGFDWAAVAVSCWLVAGLFVDGWAHNHDKVDNTFFTPWHAIFYSGYLAVAALLVGTMLINTARGYSLGRALPRGYESSLLGVAIFGAGGIGDLVWHNLFGFEIGAEALISPSHLMLILGMVLIVTGPLRAAWYRASMPNKIAYIPVLISLTLLLSLLSFIAQMAHPFVNTWAATGFRPSDGDLLIVLGGAAIWAQTAFIMGVLLLGLRRWSLPPGSVTFILTVNILLMTTQQDEYYLIWAAVITGIVGDGLLWLLKPSVERRTSFRIFAFVVPAVFWAMYFAVLATKERIWWSVHVWGGFIGMAGFIGLMLSYLLLPPPLPPAEEMLGTESLISDERHF
jgi:hypothetical protein